MIFVFANILFKNFVRVFRGEYLVILCVCVYNELALYRDPGYAGLIKSIGTCSLFCSAL